MSSHNELPEPPVPEEIGANAESASPRPNPFSEKLCRIPELLGKEFAEEWVFDDLFCRGDLIALYGPAKSGKTFMALDMIASACTGLPWCGGKFTPAGQSTIVYCAGEGLRGLKRRWQACYDAYIRRGAECASFQRIITVPLVPQLFTAASDNGVRAFLNALDGFMPDEQVDVVVIDTLNRATLGANENSAQDMGMILAAAMEIQRSKGAVVMLIHHSGKSGSSLRGSSALRAAVDVALMVEESGRGHRLSCDAIKDGERFEPIGFNLMPEGDSVVVNWTGCTESESRLTSNADRILEYLSLHPQDWHSAGQIADHTGLQRKRACETLARLDRERKVETQLTYPEKSSSNRNPRLYRASQDGSFRSTLPL